MYTEFMGLKPGPVTLHMHRFITCDVFLMRGSSFVLINKSFCDDAIREALKTLLKPRAKCVACGLVLKVGTPRVKCNKCCLFIAQHVHESAGTRMCGVIAVAIICFYHKIAKPIDDEELERLSVILAAKMKHNIIRNDGTQ